MLLKPESAGASSHWDFYYRPGNPCRPIIRMEPLAHLRPLNQTGFPSIADTGCRAMKAVYGHSLVGTPFHTMTNDKIGCVGQCFQLIPPPPLSLNYG